MDDIDGMDKFLEYMRKKANRAHSLVRKESIEGAINYVEGLQVFFDVDVDDVPDYAKSAIDGGNARKVKGRNKCIKLAIEMYTEWRAL